MQAAVFLDRDNTLIVNDGDLGDPDRVHLVNDVAAGVKKLRDAGFRIVVVTNQAGVARGVFTEDDVDKVHQRIAELVDEKARDQGIIDRFYYCPYHPEATVESYRRDHPWRKPHPGMILQAARDMQLDLARSWVIGDQARDVEAGHAAGCRTVMVTRDPKHAQSVGPDHAASSFADAVHFILNHSSRHTSGSHASIETDPPRQTSVEPLHSSAMSERLIAELASLRRAMSELLDEVRNDRMRRTEFTTLKMIAGACQLLALLLAMLGLLQLSDLAIFGRWMIAAGLAQFLTVTILILDLKG